MYELTQLETALRNAHKAGDTGAAQKLAQAIQTARAANNPAKQFNEKYGVNSFVGVPEQYNALAHGVDQGAALGFGDEITAGGAATAAKMKSLFTDQKVDWGDAYDEALAARREQMKGYSQNNPKTALGAALVGGLATGGGLASSGTTAFKGAKTLPAVMKGGAIEGAVYGGVAGAGNAESGLVDRATGAGLGAVTGAGVGAVTGAATNAVTGALTRGTNQFGSPDKQTQTRLNNALKESGLSPTQAQTKIKELGEESGIVDVLGEPGQALARSASNVSPQARDLLQNMSSTRMAGQPDRLNSVLNKAANLDKTYSTNQLINLVQTKERPAIKEAYRKAREAGHDIDMDKFNDLLESDDVAKAIKEGVGFARNQRIIDDLPLDQELSSFEILDGAKKKLDGWAKPKDSFSMNAEQFQLSKLAKKLRTRTDDELPSLEYADARGLAKKLFKQEEAIELGGLLAKPYSNDVTAKIQEVIPENRNLVGQGYAAMKLEQLNNRRTTPGVVDALFGSKNQQDALGIALGKEGAESVQKQLASERAFARTHRGLTGNSTTARQLVEMGLTGAGLGGAGAGLGYYNGGDFGSATLGALAAILARKGSGAVVSKLTAKKEAEIAPMLAKALIGKELPKEFVEEVQKDPALQRLLIHAVSQQAGGHTSEMETVQE